MPGLLVLPLVLFNGTAMLLGPMLGQMLQGMAPIFAALLSLGALAFLAVTVHEWTRSVTLAVLSVAASIVVSLFGELCLLFWAVTHTTFG